MNDVNSNGILPRKNDPAQMKPMSHGPLSPVEANEDSQVAQNYQGTGSARKASVNLGVDVNSKF